MNGALINEVRLFSADMGIVIGECFRGPAKYLNRLRSVSSLCGEYFVGLSVVHLSGGEEMEPFMQSGAAPMLLHLEPWREPYTSITAGFTGRAGGSGKNRMTASIVRFM